MIKRVVSLLKSGENSLNSDNILTFIVKVLGKLGNGQFAVIFWKAGFWKKGGVTSKKGGKQAALHSINMVLNEMKTYHLV